METVPVTPPPLSSRRSQQRSAVLAVLGLPADEVRAEAPPQEPEVAAPIEAAPAVDPVALAETTAPVVETIVGPEHAAEPVVSPASEPKVSTVETLHIKSKPVPAHRHIRRWLLATILLIIALLAAGWLAIYRLGSDSVARAAAVLPLQAGRFASQPVLLRDVFAELSRESKLAAAPLSAATSKNSGGSRKRAFANLVDQQLVRAELQQRKMSVDASQVTAALDRISRGLGSSANLETWLSQTYSMGLPEFRESALRPLLERQRLAIALAADRGRYTQAWTQADAASRLHGVVGMNDQGWLTASDLGPTVADALASASRDTRTQPIVTSDGLAVFLYTEKSMDENGATFWHVWQQLFALDPVSDFLAKSRPSADIHYYLPS